MLESRSSWVELGMSGFDDLADEDIMSLVQRNVGLTSLGFGGCSKITKAVRALVSSAL